MKIKIVNTKKFMRMMFVIICLIFVLLLGFDKTYSKTEFYYREEYIIEGDTLWSIAKNQKRDKRIL